MLLAADRHGVEGSARGDSPVGSLQNPTALAAAVACRCFPTAWKESIPGSSWAPYCYRSRSLTPVDSQIPAFI